MSVRSALSVLVIEDDPDALVNLYDILELDGYQVHVASTVAEALAFQHWSDLFAVIVDRMLPDGTADVLLPRIRELAPSAAVIVITGLSDLEGAIVALRRGAADYILKPLDAETLRARLSLLAENRVVKEALGRSEAAWTALVTAAPCMILILRADLTISYFSTYAERLTGYSAGDVLGNTSGCLFGDDLESARGFAQQMQQALDGISSGGFEQPVRCHDGRELWMIIEARRLDDYEGRPAVLIVGQDITQLRQAQDAMLQSERLAAIGQMVTGLAHESRNALQRSQACLEMLALEISDRPSTLDLIARIQKAQDHLHHLYEEVRSYAAPIRLHHELCDIRELIQESWGHLEHQHAARTARFQCAESDADWRCEADRHALEQVFCNILENSLSACADSVEIQIQMTASRLDGRSAIRISLCDNGPGLSPQQRSQIFVPFYTTKTKGTGLGMAITKRIVEAHGGSIAVGADRQPGAEIVITLPREKSDRRSE